jgi:hypothetical protein
LSFTHPFTNNTRKNLAWVFLLASAFSINPYFKIFDINSLLFNTGGFKITLGLVLALLDVWAVIWVMKRFEQY